MKDNAIYELVESREVPQRSNILKDEVIRRAGVNASEKCPHRLRRIQYYDADPDRVFEFLTNNMNLGATTIAAIYKERWQIELFFKALKQNLKMKTFVETSPTAVKTQIWTTLIAMLIARYLQLQVKFNWSLSNLVALLRMNLFTHRDLWAWLDKPFDVLPTPYEQQSLRLEPH